MSFSVDGTRGAWRFSGWNKRGMAVQWMEQEGHGGSVDGTRGAWRFSGWNKRGMAVKQLA